MTEDLCKGTSFLSGDAKRVMESFVALVHACGAIQEEDGAKAIELTEGNQTLIIKQQGSLRNFPNDDLLTDVLGVMNEWVFSRTYEVSGKKSTPYLVVMENDGEYYPVIYHDEVNKIYLPTNEFEGNSLKAEKSIQESLMIKELTELKLKDFALIYLEDLEY